MQVPGLPTRYDCSPPPPGVSGIRSPCTDGSTQPIDPNNNENPCTPTVIDHFTSSFHWAQGNVSAMWLRPLWYLVANSVLTDVQQGGITFVTGGDVTRSSIISGYWGLLRNSILVGHTQPQDKAHRFALDIGPFNSFTNADNLPLTCEPSSKTPDYCLNKQEGVSLPVGGFFNNQRLENIYDGPSYRDSNAYLDVSVSACPPDGYNGAGGCIYGSGKASGILKYPDAELAEPLLSAERSDRVEAAKRLFLSAGFSRREPLFQWWRPDPPLCDRSAVQGVQRLDFSVQKPPANDAVVGFRAGRELSQRSGCRQRALLPALRRGGETEHIFQRLHQHRPADRAE